MPAPDNIAMPSRGAWYALAASLLFGITVPLAKPLLGAIPPYILAGLFYLGSGVGLTVCRLVMYLRGQRSEPGLSLRGRDWLWLAGVIASGGVVAPGALMLGLDSTNSSTASLFLNLEVVFTVLLAGLVFKENLGPRMLAGIAAVLAGGVLLSVDFRQGLVFSAGILPICVACLGWAVDNNLTRKIAGGDAFQIASLKGLCSGSINVCLAVVMGAALPAPAYLASALIVGFFGYGLSLVLFVVALRYIGAARTGAYMAVSPFVGAAIAITFFHDPLTLPVIGAALFMALGLWLNLTDHHEHTHIHEALEHVHEHVHDEHHQHEHTPEELASKPHAHAHKHEHLEHSHPHYPDEHHDHSH